MSLEIFYALSFLLKSKFEILNTVMNYITVNFLTTVIAFFLGDLRALFFQVAADILLCFHILAVVAVNHRAGVVQSFACVVLSPYLNFSLQKGHSNFVSFIILMIFLLGYLCLHFFSLHVGQ